VTPAGRAVLAGSVVVLAVGAGAGYAELVVLGLAGLLLLVAAVPFVATPAEPLVERRVSPDRVTAGTLAEGFVTITNNGHRTMPAAVAHERVGPGRIALSVPRLRPGQAVTLAHRLPTDRRAVVPVGPLTLRRSDPFGLLARHHRDHGELRLWVHPRVHALRPSPRARRRDQEGLTDASHGGDRIFHALREYVVGDDLRRVHWKATAHRGTLMVREHVDPAQPDTTVVLDDRAAALDAERFELAVEIAASVLLASATRRFPVRLRSVSGRLGAADGTGESPTALLDRLAAAEHDDDNGIEGLIREAGTAAGRVLVLVTGELDAPTRAHTAAAAPRADALIVVSVVAPGPPADPAPAPPGATVLRVGTVADLAAAWDGLR
jgi:uncharacterized protein (DUF58 family)